MYCCAACTASFNARTTGSCTASRCSPPASSYWWSCGYASVCTWPARNERSPWCARIRNKRADEDQSQTADPERWPDFEADFNAKGCSVARRCWCMFCRDSGGSMPAAGVSLRVGRRWHMKELAAAGPQPSASVHAWRSSCRRSAIATLTRRRASFPGPAMPDSAFKSRRSASAA
jgi:hypothetical protein